MSTSTSPLGVAGRVVEGTTPYPWPYDGQLVPSTSALVIAGAQGWWAARTVGGPATVEAVAGFADRLRAVGVLVVALRHGRPGGVPAPGGPTWVREQLPLRGSSAWDLVADLAPGDLVIDAMGVDGFYGSTLDAELRAAGRTHLLFCGLGLEGPVHSTLRRANDMGYECLTVGDLTAPLEAGTRAAALSTITMSGGIFGAIGTAAAVEAALATRPDLTPSEDRP